jgi:hypothetical protein
MNYHTQLKKGILFSFLSSLALISCGVDAVSQNGVSSVVTDPVAPPPTPVILPATMATGKKKIKIALLLDTSNSMDGLIDQARAQLWKIVNELALAKCNNEKPDLEIALYEYGNDGLTEEKGFIRQVADFTNDLDLISEKLFSLKTNGGSEYCGYVISTASKQLAWNTATGDLQLMFIAGNESFEQCPVSSYVSAKSSGQDAAAACRLAKEKGIVVNTIYCGNYDQGISEGWKKGAVSTNGSYMSIEQDRKTVYIETPYDDKIAALNDKLNATYISYGLNGNSKKANQIQQDKNASGYGNANSALRTISKISGVYVTSQWDLVDASKQKKIELRKLDDSELPPELKGKTMEQKEEYIKVKTQERDEVVKEIAALSVKRNAYIVEKSKTMGTADQSLDAVMIKAIRAAAAERNFVFE